MVRIHTQIVFALLKPLSIKRANVDRKLSIVRIGRFGQFWCQRTRKICEIAWVCKKNMWNEQSDLQITKNSNSIRNFYSKIKKDFLEAVYGCFVLKIGILWFRDIEKRPLSLSYEVPPLARPITQYNGIMEYARFYENVRLGFRYCTFLHIFCVHLDSSVH